jgi:tRNA uridine 5-carboxymethylaminomethyl modification enzyme
MYDVVVIGGGHAGCEAAAAAARVGAAVCLITQRIDTVGEMSCNPSIGGVAKGIIVREIDAMGGLMALAADRAGIHYKMLNTSKGPAVWGPRAQMDRVLYKKAIQELLFSYQNLEIIEGTVTDLLIENSVISGLIVNNVKLAAKAVIITTGTFLRGVIHIGSKHSSGGRYGEAAVNGLSETLYRSGLAIKRLKTGTPPRIYRNSINWNILECQKGDNPPTPFSDRTTSVTTPQIDCYITYTTSFTHQIIKENLNRSAIYSGNISSVGPRYCPSIEDKVVRFAQKDRHQIFLEPEGLDSPLVYPNGISTSLPEETQTEIIR